ncbi:DUF465 domain-containing protein [Acinetobacter sp. 187]|uniref:DUF465 domain-containing protein n=1 Tax=Acinetobacter lanii TaxID=2715163 RepID=A0A6G8S140_9GAMM|nr:DUF465 domain-containing protein [Acinetobacter lanii]NHC03710.1 DUF465 domain-containing protein [Acinetobacter lanii]QIO07834.1 DUF465 domain-containing protein [Acinetobacter lanii]
MNTKIMNKKLKNMFPEYREIMQVLAQDDPHFARLMEDHDELDRQITQLEQDPVNLINDDIESLKRKKLKLKDSLYTLLKKAAVKDTE